ncbi:MAG: barstar family protein [Dehalococcoidia bacterium]|jgi:hypothetical protein
MDDWVTLFHSYLNSGTYYVNSGTDISMVKKAASEHGLYFLHVDLKKVTSKADLLKKVAHTLNFPGYFGMNWDALGDCFTDLSWKPAAGYVLLLTGIHQFADHSPADMKIFRDILDSSANYWKQKKVPFYIVVSES